MASNLGFVEEIQDLMGIKCENHESSNFVRKRISYRSAGIVLVLFSQIDFLSQTELKVQSRLNCNSVIYCSE